MLHDEIFQKKFEERIRNCLSYKLEAIKKEHGNVLLGENLQPQRRIQRFIRCNALL